MKSPRSGAEVACGKDSPHTWKSGESGNPQGSSLKQRSQQALAKILDESCLDAAYRNLAAIAANRKDLSNAVAAIRLIADTTGLKLVDADKIVIENNVTLLDRRDGSDAQPMRASVTGKGSARVLGSGAEQ